jgi:hypothetical protein
MYNPLWFRLDIEPNLIKNLLDREAVTSLGKGYTGQVFRAEFPSGRDWFVTGFASVHFTIR